MSARSHNTATATERVRHDIVRQLGLKEPEILVGNFDRPNLTYRVVPGRDLSGVGDAKLRDIGDRFLQEILGHCRTNNLTLDNPAGPARTEEPKVSLRPNPQRTKAFELFRRKAAIEDVMRQLAKARGTVVEYLCDY